MDRRLGRVKLVDFIKRVLAWDEERDPAAVLPKQSQDRPWRRLRLADRQLLEALSEGLWVQERLLRKQLGWGRTQFFIATLRLVQMGWLEARATAGRMWDSDYRLNPEVWVK
jgi:hypothetical protein